MSTKIIRPTDSDTTHRVYGSAPGWADCNAWVQGGETLAEDATATCPPCAANAAWEASTNPFRPHPDATAFTSSSTDSSA